jgi:hypothetical protein
MRRKFEHPRCDMQQRAEGGARDKTETKQPKEGTLPRIVPPGSHFLMQIGIVAICHRFLFF